MGPDPRSKILREIKESLKDRGVKVTIDEKTGVLRLPEDILFGPGDYMVLDIRAHG